MSADILESSWKNVLRDNIFMNITDIILGDTLNMSFYIKNQLWQLLHVSEFSEKNQINNKYIDKNLNVQVKLFDRLSLFDQGKYWQSPND